MDGAFNQPMDGVSVCVLASGSGGNCTALSVRSGARRSVVLMDAGLSPRRTRRLLGQMGRSLEDVCAVVLTHLDRDHWRREWLSALPETADVWVHRAHWEAARAWDLLPARAIPFDSPFEAVAGLQLDPLLLAHDSLGVAAFRIAGAGSTLGFATDVGRVTDGLVRHLQGVDVLAIESNYCRRLQLESDRPWFLKRRIMGGRGHLSNDDAARAVVRIGPRRHVVLLHLSRQCNRPDIVNALHAGADYRLTITDQFVPTSWITVGPSPPDVVTTIPATLWELAP